MPVTTNSLLENKWCVLCAAQHTCIYNKEATGLSQPYFGCNSFHRKTLSQ